MKKSFKTKSGDIDVFGQHIIHLDETHYCIRKKTDTEHMQLRQYFIRKKENTNDPVFILLDHLLFECSEQKDNEPIKTDSEVLAVSS
jgi:hypothetical protein